MMEAGAFNDSNKGLCSDGSRGLVNTTSGQWMRRRDCDLATWCGNNLGTSGWCAEDKGRSQRRAGVGLRRGLSPVQNKLG